MALIAAAVLGVALLGGAVKLACDMKKVPADAPRPKQPWERLP